MGAVCAVGVPVKTVRRNTSATHSAHSCADAATTTNDFSDDVMLNSSGSVGRVDGGETEREKDGGIRASGKCNL